MPKVQPKVSYIAGILSERGTFRPAESWSLYVVCCVPRDGKFLAKIGISSVVYERVASLKSGIPYPLDTVLHESTGTKRNAAIIERILHEAFADRRTHGEWFEFDLLADRARFGETMRTVFRSVMRRELKWRQFGPKDLAAFQTQKQKTARGRQPKPMGKREQQRRQQAERMRLMDEYRKAS